MRKIGHKIAKPFILHFLYKHLILRVFHSFFTGFSWPFHGVTIFANLEVAPSIFQALDIFGGGTCSAKSHKNTTSKIIT